jgi:hypothetical protein
MPQQETIERLTYLCNTLPQLMKQISEADFAHKPATGKWSKKETLGHLIDSATNNHQRFIRIQFEHEPCIFYDQNNWNLFSHYNKLESAHIINFWELYNRHLLEIIKRIPEVYLSLSSITSNDEKVTLGFLIDDYVVHMEHHLKQIVKY